MSAFAVIQPETGAWRVGNAAIEQTLRCPLGGSLEVLSIIGGPSGREWSTSPFTPVLSSGEPPVVLSATPEPDAAGGAAELSVALQVVGGLVLHYHLWAPPDLPVLRTWVEVENPYPDARVLHDVGLLRLSLVPGSDPLRVFTVETFAGHRLDKWDETDNNFRTHERALMPGEALALEVGAYRAMCSWVALCGEGSGNGSGNSAGNGAGNGAGEGLVMGLEYDGASVIEVRAGTGACEVIASMVPAPDLPVPPGRRLRLGGAFYGLFRDGWDGAAHLTHRLVEEHLAAPLAAPMMDGRFPPVVFNTWHYQTGIDQERVARMVDIAADLGGEAFDVDYGWSRAIGDWHPNERFPGLRALMDRIHARGMATGLWMAFANAAADAPVLREHPDWACGPDDWGSFGTRALCLAHEPVRDWAVAEILRVVDDYGVDWLKHDFEIITPCARTDHRHPPMASDFLSVQAFHEVLRRVIAARPELVLENCQGGGRLMTYDMVKTHHTSITGDGGVLLDARLRREALYGSTFPFPARYCDCYMEEAPTPYACRSSMLGGPWILMHAFLEWTPEERMACLEHVRLFQEIRPFLRSGRVVHIAPPGVGEWDAMGYYDREGRRGVAFVFRPDSRDSGWTLRLPGLEPGRRYTLRARDAGTSWTVTGSDLARDGVHLTLPEPFSSEVVFIEPTGGPADAAGVQ